MTDETKMESQAVVGAPSDEAANEARDGASSRQNEGMQSLMDRLERDYRTPQRGEVLEGVIVSIDKDGALVDIGTKSEGLIPSHELQAAQELDGALKVGDEVVAYVVQSENRDGHVVLSLRRARAERGWRQVQKRFEENATIEAEVIDCNKGGLIVSVNGLRGFVPSSQVVGFRQTQASDKDKDEVDERLAAMVGKRIPLKVLEINRRRNRLILSERAATQEMRQRRKEELLNELEPGQVRHGRVSSICDFGAFVDLGGADGLVHISELAWSPTSHPSEVVSVGQEVDVQVLSVDREKKKIALSLRRAKPEPWSTVGSQYNVGDEVRAKITKLASFGAFARVQDGVEGLIHISELSDARISHPKNVVKEGDELTLKIIRVEPERRRLGLSLRQVSQRQPVAEPPSGAEVPQGAVAPQASTGGVAEADQPAEKAGQKQEPEPSEAQPQTE